MTRVRRRTTRAHRERPLNLTERLDLTFGPGSADLGDLIRWRTDADRREVWADHRNEMLPTVRPGVRPMAFWQYETDFTPDWPGAPELYDPRLIGERRPGPDWSAYLAGVRTSIAYLAGHDELSADEIAALRAPVLAIDGTADDWAEAAMRGLDEGLRTLAAGRP